LPSRSRAARLSSNTAGAWSNTKQRLPFSIISKVPWRTFGHSLAIEAKAWAWQACSGVLAFLSAAYADETKATTAAVAMAVFVIVGTCFAMIMSAGSCWPALLLPSNVRSRPLLRIP
jgi:hypothetical protein